MGTHHQPDSARSYELALRTVGAACGCPGAAPLAWVWGVRGRALSHPRPLVLRACGRGPLPTGCGCGGCGRGDPAPTPQRSLLRAGFARCGGGTKAPGGGASCLGVGRPGTGALPPRMSRPFGHAPGARLPLALGAVCRLWGLGCPWHLVSCRGSSCVVRASRVRVTRWPLWLGTCPRAVVVAGGVPPWRASWPRVGAPLLFWSVCSRCSGRLSRRCGAFPHPRGCRPRLYWVAARGTWRPAENQALCACHWPLPRQGRWARSASYLFGAPRWGCPWRVPQASVLGCVRCGGFACVGPVTDASGFPYCPSFDGGLDRCSGAVSCGCRHRPLRVGGRHARVQRVCACACPAWLGRAGRPPGRVFVRLTFLLAGLGALLACSAPSWLGLPRWWLCLGFSSSLPPPCCTPVVSCFACFPAPGRLGPWRLLAPPPSPPLCAPLSPALHVFRPWVPWALASCCHPPPFLFSPSPLRCAALSPALRVFRGALGLCASSPPCLFFPLFLVLSLLFLPVVRCGAGLCVLGRRVCLCVPWWCCPSLCAVCAGRCCVVLAVRPGCCLLVGLGVVFRWCCPCLAAWLAALWFGVVCLGVLLPCVVFCCAVLSCGVVLSCSAACLRRCPCLLFVSCRCASAVCVLGCRAVCSLCSPPCAVLCCAVMVPFRCAVPVVCAVSGGWCCWFLVLLAFVGGLLVALVARRCRSVGVSALMPVSGLAVARGLLRGVLLPCVVSCGALLPCGAVLWCPVFFFCFFSCWWRWFPVVPCWFCAPGRFRVVSVSVLCLCGAVLVCLCRCSRCGALLPLQGLAGVLCCCLLCLCVCCWAWLSSVVSWWVVVAPGVVSRWRAVVCPWVLCCAVLLRVVPPGVAALCAVLFHFAAARCVVSWNAVRRLGVLCLLAPCFVLSPRAVCVLLWFVAAWCCSPLCLVPCAPWGVMLCVSCRLHPVRCCCVARCPSVPCSPVLCPVVLCCRVVPMCPVLQPCWVCFLRGCGCTYLKNRCKIS